MPLTARVRIDPRTLNRTMYKVSLAIVTALVASAVKAALSKCPICQFPTLPALVAWNPPKYPVVAVVTARRPTWTEPLLTVGGITSAVSALLGLLVAFDVLHPTPAQTESLLWIAAVVAPLVVAWLGRKRVYSPATVSKLIAKAARGDQT